MHVQLPKPLHGWREFTGEVGVALVTSQVFQQAKPLDLHALKNVTPGSRAICLPMTTTRAEANRISVWPFGEP